MANDLPCQPDDHELYRRLGVPPTASDSQIRKAYLTAAKQLHPDRGGGPEAAKALAQIGEAWAVLRNPLTRKVYDEDGVKGLEALDDEGGVAAFEDDDDLESEEEDDDDSDDEDSSSPQLPSVAAFFGASAPSVSDGVGVAAGKSHSARWAQGIAGRVRAQQGDGTTPVVDRDVILHVADAVAEAIRRTEERAAARYERALALLLRSMDPHADAATAEARAKRAWFDAAAA